MASITGLCIQIQCHPVHRLLLENPAWLRQHPPEKAMGGGGKAEVAASRTATRAASEPAPPPPLLPPLPPLPLLLGLLPLADSSATIKRALQERTHDNKIR